MVRPKAVEVFHSNEGSGGKWRHKGNEKKSRSVHGIAGGARNASLAIHYVERLYSLEFQGIKKTKS